MPQQGFFAASTLIAKPPPALVPRCGLCQLYKSCQSPKMPVWGHGKAKVLIVGEGPATDEDKCLVPETLVLMKDLSWKQLSNVEVGDEIISVDEDAAGGNRPRKWNIATVTKKKTRVAKCWKVVTSVGELIGSGDHLVLVGKGSKTQWRRLEKLSAGKKRSSRVMTIGKVWKRGLSYNTGWLAGFLDGEGCVRGSRGGKKMNGTVGFTQNAGALEKRASRLIRKYGFKLGSKEEQKTNGVICCRRYILGSLIENMRFLGIVRPKRLLKHFARVLPNRYTRKLQRATVKSRIPAGLREVIDISTTSGTFIANGIVVHNCGKPFVGRAGKHLRDVCHKLGVNLDVDCWVTNAIICMPKDAGGKWRNPTEAEIDHCRPNVMNAIKTLKPETVILLGNGAVQSVIGGIWKSDPGGVGKWAGWRIPFQKSNYWLCPTYHPSYCLREEDPVLDRYFEQTLKAAFELKGRPWPNGPPDYKKQITITLGDKQSAFNIRQFIKAGKTVAFDTESNYLKPDRSDARLICASVSNGDATIAFPWHGEAITAMGELLQSDVGKCAHNMKHEARWMLKVFGKPVRKWKLCTMVGAHVEQNREGICGLKFQSFVRLGVESYDDSIKQFMKGKGGKGLNQLLDEVDLQQLLLYCAYDSLYERLLAEIQAKELGVEL